MLHRQRWMVGPHAAVNPPMICMVAFTRSQSRSAELDGATSVAVEGVQSVEVALGLRLWFPVRSPPVAPTPARYVLASGHPRCPIACVSPSRRR